MISVTNPVGRYLETLTFEVDTDAQTHISGVQDLQSEFNGFNQSAIQSILFKTCVLLGKESVYSDGEQFYQYQQNVQSPLTSNHFTYATFGYSKQKTSILLFIYKKD